MKPKTTDQIEAEIEALRLRIRRLRAEKKVAALAEAERQLMELAGCDPNDKEARCE